jgi:thiazole/oxazole-forming peptide maturase SagD family component
VGENKPIDFVSVDIFSDTAQQLSYYHASAHYKKPNESYLGDNDERYASGTATSMHLAQIKAIAEAYERFASGEIKFETVECARNLDKRWIDPRHIRPLDEQQIASAPQLTTFTENTELEWISGVELHSNDEILLPIDIVLYPLSEQELGRKLVAHADSSGVSAHTDRDIAIEKGLLELIERDAIMRNWFKKEPLPKIAHHLLDKETTASVKKWEEKGYLVEVLDMTPGDKPAAIVNVVIRNNENSYPYFSNGASAARTYEEAIQKGLEEAELGLLHALHAEKEDALEKTHIHSPSGHGIFYLHPQNSMHIEWLWQGKTIYELQNIDDNASLVGRYNPIVVDLGTQRAPLHVVRIIEPSLVPISFGYRSEYYLHLQSGVDPHRYRPDIPHYFA